MEDSPRSSKRRKLDTPTSTAASPLAKSTLRKPSARLTSRQVPVVIEDSEASADEAPTPVQPSKKAPNGTVKGTPLKRGVKKGKDVYDDFEGALPQKTESRAPSPTPKKVATPKRRKKPIKSYNFDPSLPHPFKRSAPSTAPIQPENENPASASRAPFRSVVNGYEHGDDDDTIDELAGTVATSTKKTKAVGATSGRKLSPTKGKGVTPAKKPVGRASRGAVTDVDVSLDPLQDHEVNGITPSKTRSGRKVAGSAKVQKENSKRIAAAKEPVAAPPSRTTRRQAPVPDSEDSLGDRAPSRRTPQDPWQRRRANRADHVQSAEEDSVEEDEEDVDGNSVLGSVLDPTEPSPFNKPSLAPKITDETAAVQGSLPSGRELDLLKIIAMDRIMGKRPVPLVSLDKEFQAVHQLVEHTITAGEGNSMLIIGARGSGKTSLVNKVLSEISKDQAEEYHVVRLNGFIHTDDKIALREIWRQLGKEMDTEEDASGIGKNYADTLITLLALLSHPSEHTGVLTDEVAKAVIFVMDEFDQFAMHPRQTLLYNLFDIAQSRKAPIAVLGLTTRIDVVDSLEKRVKSRFSHRYVHLSLAKTFTSFQEMCKASLLIQPDQLSIEERSILCSAPKATTPAKKKKTKQTAGPDFLTTWNGNISSILASKSFLTSQLAPHYYKTKSVPSALNQFLYPVAAVSSDCPLSISTSTSLNPPDSKLSLIPHLSTLSLSLLIAAARLDIIHDSDTCNFNMAYDEYVTLASKARIQSAAGGSSASGSVSKVWGKEVARREWEGLVDLGLVVPLFGGQVGAFGMVKCDVALEEIGAEVQADKGIERALERWCKQL